MSIVMEKDVFEQAFKKRIKKNAETIIKNEEHIDTLKRKIADVYVDMNLKGEGEKHRDLIEKYKKDIEKIKKKVEDLYEEQEKLEKMSNETKYTSECTI